MSRKDFAATAAEETPIFILGGEPEIMTESVECLAEPRP
jgi:UDP-N-acetyl-D-mannosaminuronic acid transferase (WecB/TagA/CpsF family)